MGRAKNITHLLLNRLIENPDKTPREVAEDLIKEDKSIEDIAHDLGLNSCSIWAREAILRFIEDTGAGTYEPDKRYWQKPALTHEHYQ